MCVIVSSQAERELIGNNDPANNQRGDAYGGDGVYGLPPAAVCPTWRRMRWQLKLRPAAPAGTLVNER